MLSDTVTSLPFVFKQTRTVLIPQKKKTKKKGEMKVTSLTLIVSLLLLINNYRYCECKINLIEVNRYFSDVIYYMTAYPYDGIYKSLWLILDPFYRRGITDANSALFRKVLHKWVQKHEDIKGESTKK